MSVVIEMMVCKRDAFYDAGRNFYLYYDPVRLRFVYIPDDFDYSFSDEFGFDLNFQNDQSPHLGDVSNIIINQFFKSDRLKKQYYSKACELIHRSFDPDRLNRYIDKLEILEKNWNFDFEDFSMRTDDEIRKFITARKIQIESDFHTANYSCNPDATGETLPPAAGLVVYPNPAGDHLNIRVNDLGSRYDIELSDLTGRLLRTSRNLYGNQPVSLMQMPPGIYVMRVISGKEVHTVKIVKL
jgi:hypothetical protein